MGEHSIPKVPLEIIEYLEEYYRDTVPGLHDDDRTIWIKVGQVELTRHLRSLHDMQQEDDLSARMKHTP